MPKLKNVSQEELETLIEQVFDMSQMANGLKTRIDQGYLDGTIAQPVRLVLALSAGILALSNLMHLLARTKKPRR
jgi:hypothetical protein